MRSSSCMARGRLQQEILVHDEERAHLHGVLHVLHDLEKLIAGFVKVDALTLAAEECRGGAEVASHGAADRGDDGGCGVAGVVGNAHSQHPHAEAGEDFGMLDRRVGIVAQIAAHPGDAFAAHDDNRHQSVCRAREWRRHDRRRRWWSWATGCARGGTFRVPCRSSGMMPEMPTMSYSVEVSSRSKRSRVGKSSSVLGAEMLRWIIIRPQER